MKVCTKCAETLPLSAFYARKAGGHQGCCRRCWKDKSRAYNAANPEKIAAHRKTYREKNKPRIAALTRRSALKVRYGITEAEQAALLTKQNGACRICGATDRRLVIDHHHGTGRVRMLLCDPCNRGLGCFNDDPDLLKRAAEVIAAFTECAP